ncbi:MAG: sigma-70 family RNA polymerase sigma factor [Vicinamibacterales bacterium]
MPPAGRDGSPDVTTLLSRWQEGHADALDQAAAVVLPELRQIAQAYLRRERPDHTLQPTALVHEAFMRLVEAGQLAFDSRRQFYALAAQLMRRILVDHARATRAAKRGGGAVHVSVDDVNLPSTADADRFLDLHDALDRLAASEPRKARVIELRYFGGLTLEETADVLGVAVVTAHRDQRFAEAWLGDALGA